MTSQKNPQPQSFDIDEIINKLLQARKEFPYPFTISIYLNRVTKLT